MDDNKDKSVGEQYASRYLAGAARQGGETLSEICDDWKSGIISGQESMARVAVHIAGTSQATKAQAEPEGLRDELQQTVSDFRKATYEFARGMDPDDHARMMAAQKRIFAIADQLAAAPVASVAKEAKKEQQALAIAVKTWKDAPYKLDHVAEARARGWNDAIAELRKTQLGLITLPCPECAGKRIVDIDEACEECNGQGKIIVASSDRAPTTSTVSAPLGYVSDDAMATLSAGSGVLTAIIPRAINGADRAIYAGAQAAPEEVRNQALEILERCIADEKRGWSNEDRNAIDFALGSLLGRFKIQAERLRTTSTDQANADTGSAK